VRHRIETRIDIAAPPERVWAVLTDLDAYEHWNPFIVASQGEVRVGGRLRNRMHPPDGRATTFKPVVTIAEPPRTFEWLGHAGIPGVFEGRHRFELEPTDAGTHLVHSEDFTGVLIRPALGFLNGKTRRGFEEMNAALKARAEST
jgi:hypothetical protein